MIIMMIAMVMLTMLRKLMMMIVIAMTMVMMVVMMIMTMKMIIDDPLLRMDVAVLALPISYDLDRGNNKSSVPSEENETRKNNAKQHYCRTVPVFSKQDVFAPCP